MRHTESILLILVLILLGGTAGLSTSFAQTAKYDVFPLKPGLHYKYHYYSHSEDFSVLYGVMSSVTDSGSIEYVVHDSVAAGDTAVVWNVEERLSLLETWGGRYSMDTVFWSKDTSFFPLREGKNFNHELSSVSRVWWFPLWNSDTTHPVFRFSDTTSLLVSDTWAPSLPDCIQGRDSLWLIDAVGLVRRKSWSSGGCANTHSAGSTEIELDGNPTLAVPTHEPLPDNSTLQQNYPNPFNPSTTIRYALPHRSHVTLTVFNTLGQQIATLVNGEDEAGYHEVEFNATSLASGVYFYRLVAGSYTQTRRMLLVR